jgi:DNA mismatch repair protein MutL
LEVRFADEAGAHQQIEAAIRDALLDHGLIRTSAPRGQSAPAETDVAPESPDASEAGTSVSGAGDGTSAASETGEAATAGSRPDDTTTVASDAEDATRRRPADAAGTSTSTTPATESTTPATESSTLDAESTTSADAESTGSVAPAQGQAGDAETADRPEASRTGHAHTTTEDTCAAVEATTDASEGSRLSTLTDQASLETGVETTTEFDGLPTLSILGQFQDTYVVCASDDGLVVIDQHAADERVNYERLREAFEAGTTSQRLATPITLELTAREAAVFEAHAEDLADLGFETERADERTVSVGAVPAVFDATLDPSVLRDALASFAAGRDGTADVEAVAEELLADLACYPAITGATSLTEGTILDLLESLADCENPYACPHGRPVLIELSTDELAARFERDYPGHGPRRAE